MRRLRQVLAVALAGVLAVPAVTALADAPAPAAAALAAGAAATEPGHGLDPLRPAGCDRIDPSHCMLPYPSDWWTRPDATTVTGRRVDLTAAAVPRNVAGRPMSTAEYNRLDGFSPGSILVTHLPGLHSQEAFDRSRIVPINDMGQYARPDQPVVVINAATGQRHPVWAEVDSNGGSPEQTALLIHPTTNFREATRYIVAIRGVVDANGQPIQPSPAFRAYRDGKAAVADPRRAHMEHLFGELATAGVARGDLTVAWDFTVASARSIAGRMLSMRDRAFADLGDTNLADRTVAGRSPDFDVVSVTNYTAAEDSRIGRQVELDVTVPCFIWPNCSAPTKATDAPVPEPVGSELPLDSAPPNAGTGKFLLRDPASAYAVPQRNPAPFKARVTCNIPRVGLDPQSPVALRPALYGHGLFGTGSEVDAGNVKDFSQRHGFMFCAPTWVGMGTGDVPNAVAATVDMSNFPLLADRMQQGILDFLVVGRALLHAQGFSAHPAFRVGGRSVLDTTRLYYDGNSQGGIYGGTVCALSPDADRCVLGVPGMAYSMLLYRSSDFVDTGADPVEKLRDAEVPVAYATPFEASYRQPLERVLILTMIQSLWDRSDPNGYAQHMTKEPLPDTPPHEVLLHVAFGDHQVTHFAADAEARTVGAGVVWPALEDDSRSPDVVDYWGIPRITTFPYAGSAMTVFDTGPTRVELGQVRGTDAPPTVNKPNLSGTDPHGAPRRTQCGQQQKADFLSPSGLVTAPCGGGPYFAGGYRNALD